MWQKCEKKIHSKSHEKMLIPIWWCFFCRIWPQKYRLQGQNGQNNKNWALDSEPGKWEKFKIFLQKNYVFWFFWRVILHVFAKSDFFCKKKKPAGILTHNKWVVDSKMAKNLHRFLKKNVEKSKMAWMSHSVELFEKLFFFPRQIDHSGSI